MYKCALIDKSMMEFEDIMITDKESLKALMDFAWNPCKVDTVTAYNYEDINMGFEVIAIIFGGKDEEDKRIKLKVGDGYSAGTLTSYFINDNHFASGDEICAKPVKFGGEDE